MVRNGMVAARGETVDHSGQVGLARPRLAADHDGRVHWGDPPDLLGPSGLIRPAGRNKNGDSIPQRSDLAQVGLRRSEAGAVAHSGIC